MSFPGTGCDHTPVKIRPASWVFGTPGWLFARYKCAKCNIEWDDPTETPSNPTGEKGWNYPNVR